MSDPYNLDRFVYGQRETFDRALAEVEAGQKTALRMIWRSEKPVRRSDNWKETGPIPIYPLHRIGGDMANGWARDGAVQDQIDDTVSDAVLAARARIPGGESAEECDDCGEPIPSRRRAALPGVRTCVACQAERDRKPVFSGINRRGSKDSQLR